jgi:hypothetical protein
MNELFKNLEQPDQPAGGNNISRLMEENMEDVLENLEDELDELEKKEQQQPDIGGQQLVSSSATRGMDIERLRPNIHTQAQKAQTATNKGGASDSFIRSLYTRQTERMRPNPDFVFFSKDVETFEERNYELDLNEDGKAQFFYIDVQEDFNHKSRLFVYGKVKVKGGENVSCCLAVNNMEREYYFFKRDNDQVVELCELENF